MSVEVTLRSVPTAPGHLPGLGHLLPLLRRPLEFVRTLHHHGDVVRVQFATVPVYIVTSPEVVWEILVLKARDFDKGRIFDQGKAFLGEGLITSAGELHRNQRRLIQPIFQRPRIERHADVMRGLAAELAGSWRAGEPVVVDELMNRLALKVVARFLFSADIAPTTAERIHQALPVLLRGSMLRAFVPGFERAPIAANQRYRRAVLSVRSVVDELLAQHAAGSADGDDPVRILRSTPTTGAAMTAVQLRDELLTIMIAGTETTGGALAWTLYEVSQRPDVQRRLHDEVDRVVGLRPVTAEDLPALEYTQRVLRETLRLHAPWLSTRRASRAVGVGGLELPAGTELAFSLYALHRDPRFHARPDDFEPDRWLPDRAEHLPRGAYIPFLEGSRKCIGDWFAWTEMVTVIATVAAQWRLELAPGVRIREVPIATIRPSRLTMVPRARER